LFYITLDNLCIKHKEVILKHHIHHITRIADNNTKQINQENDAMRTLPNKLKATYRTPDFDQGSVPAGILGRHITSEGIWGEITVSTGSLTYQILEPELQEYRLDKNHTGIIEPQIAHQIVTNGVSKFHIQFFKELL